eukprot:s737_g35.t1
MHPWLILAAGFSSLVTVSVSRCVADHPSLPDLAQKIDSVVLSAHTGTRLNEPRHVVAFLRPDYQHWVCPAIPLYRLWYNFLSTYTTSRPITLHRCAMTVDNGRTSYRDFLSEAG